MLPAPQPAGEIVLPVSVMDASFWVVTGHLYLSIREVAVSVLCPFSEGNAQVLMQGCREPGCGGVRRELVWVGAARRTSPGRRRCSDGIPCQKCYIC